MPDDQILIVCVHFRRPEETALFVKSAVQQKVNASVEVLVVDNSPQPPEEAVPESLGHLRCVTVLEPGKNLGYFGGASYALKHYLGAHPMPTWVIVSNPDIEWPNDGVLQKLVDLHKGREPAVIAPSIRTITSGIDQNPYMRNRPANWRMLFYRWMFSTYPTDAFYQTVSWFALKVRKTIRNGAMAIRPTAPCVEAIYAPHGSFVPLHRSYFEHGGTLDYAAVLFGEEIFVGESARRLGLTVLYEPGVELRHEGHTSMGGIYNRPIARLRKDASRYLAETFF